MILVMMLRFSLSAVSTFSLLINLFSWLISYTFCVFVLATLVCSVCGTVMNESVV